MGAGLMAAAAAGGAAGGIIQGGIDAYNAYAQREFNRVEAQKNRDFQKYMANTAIQRQFADARAAGISPAMLLGGGTGAATPGGATASTGAAHTPDIIGIINAVASSFRAEEQQDHNNKIKELKELKEQNNKTSNSAKAYDNQRTYNKKDIKNIYTDLDKLDF